MKNGKTTNWLLILSVIILLFGSGYKLGEHNAQKSSGGKTSFNLLNTNQQAAASQRNVNFNLFWEVWDKLQEKYVDRTKLNAQKMFYGSLKGLVASLDDNYTFFLTPEENKQSKDDLGGKFQGIGAQLGLKNNLVVILAPLKNSPAQKAGVRAGDIILKVDGQSTKGWTLPQTVSKIRGDKGTKVSLTLFRNGKDFTVTIMRDEIQVDSIELSYEHEVDCKTQCPQVAYLKLNQFGETTNSEWDKAASEIAQKWQQKKIKGLVFDVRDNPGGFLDSSVHIASDFLSQGKLVVKQESTTGENRDYYVDRQGVLLDIPMTVLINQGSASASEILSGSLQDYGRAKLIGEKSFGKGSVQEALDLTDGSGLHVTIAKWILPKGRWINGKGVDPDIKVDNKPQEGTSLTRDRDLQLEKGVETLVK